MTILDVLSSPWAIVPDRLEEIQSIYAARARGDELDIPAIEARIGRPLSNDSQPYEVRNGTALIPLQGVLGQRMNLMSNISGGTSTELFARDIRAAAADPKVQSIIILADTPGGTVAGTQTAAAAVRAVRGVKPIATLVQGMMASAGAWIGTAADLVVMDSGTAQAGSIGVVATHTDVSQREQQMGIKTTEIVAGRFKRAASQYGPLTETGKAVIQSEVDYLYSLIVADVAANRGTTVADVLERMADGRMFIGQQAVDAGLVDSITSLEELIVQLNSSASANQRSATLALTPMDSNKTPNELAAEWSAENPEAAAVLRAEGAASERDRIAGVRAQAMPGHEALIEQLAADGHTSGPEAAVQVLAAVRQAQTAKAAARLAEAPEPVAFAPAPEALEAVQAPEPEISARDLADTARSEMDKARAEGRTLSAVDAVARAKRQFSASPLRG